MTAEFATLGRGAGLEPVAGRPPLLLRWLNRRRLTVYPAAFAVGLALLWAFWCAGGDGILDRTGRPIGTDFVAFYSASEIALAGDAASAYDATAIHEVEQRITGGAVEEPLEWHYPPAFLLAVLPLSKLPYLVALATWLAVTGLALVYVVRRFAADHVALLLLVAFPGFYRNLTQGQNGFLTAALLGGGLLLLERRPWLAGLVLGLLSYKPHLGALVFVALLAGRQTRALGGALVSTGITAVVALAAFGPETYLQFFEDIPHASALLYDQALPLHKMHTLSSALLLLGVPALAAKLLQAAFSLAVVAAVVWVWRRSGRPYLRFAALGIGILAATPFAFDYDLVVLALPLLWLGLEGLDTGWLPWERELIVLAWATPFLAAGIVLATSLMVTPLVLLALLWFVLRRVGVEGLRPVAAAPQPSNA